MSKLPAVLKIVGVVAIVAALGVTIGLVSSRKPAKPETAAVPGQEASVSAEHPQNPPKVTRPVQVPAVPPPVVQSAVPAPPNTIEQAQTPPPANVITNWESKLEEILDSDVAEKEKATQMAASFPNLPEEGQMEVAQHLSNLVADEDYSLISGFLNNTGLSEEVLDVFLADSLNRPNAVKLPALLEVARNDQHPKAAEAKEILELFLEEDYGKDWNLWNTKMQEWIQNNPD